jgi:hypothetical protein
MKQSYFYHHSGRFGVLAPTNMAKHPGSNSGCLAWKNRVLMNIALAVKDDHQHALDIQPHLHRFLWALRGWAFPLIELLFGFWVITVNPGFVSCYDP